MKLHFQQAGQAERAKPVATARLLGRLRDELETYFALEEFFGYFQNAEVNNPSVEQQAGKLRIEHESLFVQLNNVVDAVEQIVYHECRAEDAFDNVETEFQSFMSRLQRHEDQEMQLVMRLHNEEIGVGD